MSNEFRCRICGCFIGYRELNTDEINILYAPDTEFTVEKTEYEHKKHYEYGIWKKLKKGYPNEPNPMADHTLSDTELASVVR